MRELAMYALVAAQRAMNVPNFRETPDPRDHEDRLRGAYHRERDRLIWAKAFKRLQNKTQVFPHYVEDHFKRRLTHALEVSAIATAIARQLQLNEVVTEAIGLGHDLGHTPFGHAGEEALNEVSVEYFKDSTNANEEIPLSGFNHCVQGIEVVSRIEKHKLCMGLNLSLDVRDGILKHICSRTDEDTLRKKPYFGLDNIVNCPLYKQYEGSKHGSLEAQCVWFADKLCYLFGDIEDGLRAGVFDQRQLVTHEFGKFLQREYFEYVKTFQKKQQQDAKKEWKELFSDKTEIMDRFYYARNKAITLSIKNCLKEFHQKIEDKGVETVDDVLTCDTRLIDVSGEWKSKWMEFYRIFMVERLFRDVRVEDANYRAGQIVNKLFRCYLDAPKTIHKTFREDTRKGYEDVVDNALLPFITARNYVSGMTDSFAIQEYEKLFYSGKAFPFLTPRIEQIAVKGKT